MSCIISPYHTNKGYAYKKHKGKLYGHHRLVYEQHNGPIPKGMVIMHTCDNRSCINIDHLRLGTNKDNMDDRDQKQRQAKGIDIAMSKLNDLDVLFIRSSSLKHYELAKKFGVHDTTIRKVRDRTTWKHL